MEPFTLVSFIIGAALGGIIGNRADDVFIQTMRGITDRMRRGGPPVNHDLQRAVRKAYLQATLVVCEARLKASGIAPGRWRRDLRDALFPVAEVRWLDTVRRELGEEVRRLSQADYIPPSSAAEHQIELLLQPKGVTADQRVAELRAALLEGLLAELREKHGEPPARFAEMLRRGWEENAPDEGAARLDWFGLLCAFFVHELKHNDVVANVFEGQLLAQLTVEGTPLTAQVLQAQFEQWGRAMAQRLDQMGERLEQLQHEQAEGFAAVQARLDEALPVLALLPDLSVQQQALSALVQTALRESRRRPLYARYAGREVADRIDKLLDDYAMLFVGRDDELARLDGLLVEKSCGTLLVTAKAGFGKTALLANWLRARHGEGCFIAYHFFSSHYDVTRSLVNAYRNLLRQLFVYHELADESLPHDENQLRETLYGLLQERGARPDEPLVILLDGVDEAEKTFYPPFPPRLPDGVFVIASARAEEGEEPEYLHGWLDGAEHLHLTRLPHSAVAAYLRRAGAGELAELTEDVGLIAQVDETTEGFPLYLRFLGEEMIAAAKAGQDVRAVLTRSLRGFGAYVREQLKQLAQAVRQQREVQDLFALLSAALGPLSEDDLQAVSALTAFDLQALPWQVTRWFTIVRSDGFSRPAAKAATTSQTLYTFAHPLLAGEFERALGRQAQQAREKLLEYCARWLEHRSGYALRHYPAHLRQAGRQKELFEMAHDDAFRQAQAEVYPDEPGLALMTLQTALLGAAETDQAGMIAELLLKHARQLMAIREESPLKALREGNLQRAWVLADLHEIERCALWHLLLAWELKDTGRMEEARATLERLLKKELPRLKGWQGEYAANLLAYALEVREHTFTSLHRMLLDDDGYRDLSKQLGARGHFAAALETVQRIEAPDRRAKTLAAITYMQRLKLEELHSGIDRVEALAAMAEVQARIGERRAAQAIFAIALETARGLEDEEERADALATITKVQIRAEKSAVRQVVQEIENEQLGAEALAAIAAAQAKAGNRGVARATFGAAREAAQWIGDPEERAKALTMIAKAEAEAGVSETARDTFAAALETLPGIEQREERVKTLAAIAKAQTQIGAQEIARITFTAVREIAHGIEDAEKRTRAIIKIARAQAEAGERVAAQASFANASETAQGIRDVWGQTWALLAVAEAHAETGDREAAQGTFITACEKARGIESRDVQAEALAAIAKAQAKVGEFAAAHKTAGQMTGTDERYEAVMAIANAQADAGELAAAVETARWIERPETALIAIAEVQARVGEFGAALQTVQGINEYALERARVLMAIARAQAKAGEFGASFKTVREIKYPEERAKALATIAKSQARAGEFAVALQTAQEIRHAVEFAKVLVEIAEAQATAAEKEAARSTFASAYQTAQGIEDAKNRAKMMAAVAGAQAKAGFGGEALRTAQAILNDRNRHLPEIASALIEARDTEHFKQLLIPCAYYLDAAYTMCGLLARVYPEQAGAVAEVVKGEYR